MIGAAESLKNRPPTLMLSNQMTSHIFWYSRFKFFMLFLVFWCFYPLLAEWLIKFLVFLTNYLAVMPVSLTRAANVNLLGLVSPCWAIQTMVFRDTQALRLGYLSWDSGSSVFLC